MRDDPDALFYNALRFHNLSQLSQGLLHDLRSPLNAIVMNLELLRCAAGADPAQEERLQRYIQAIDRAVERLEGVISLCDEGMALSPETDAAVELVILFARLERWLATQARLRQVALHIQAPAEGLKIKHSAWTQEALLALALAALEASPAQSMLAVEADANAGSVLITIRALGVDPARVDRSLNAARQLLKTRGITVEMALRPDAQCCLQITVPLAQTSPTS